MLLNISIRNFALIDLIEIDLKKGFTVISGETGSGKSIFLEAIQLLLGKRSDKSSIKNKSKKCIIEGELLIEEKYKSLFNKFDLDYKKISIIRREISSNGKSRNFINDTPISLFNLTYITEKIIELYSQNESYHLRSEDKQLGLIDIYSDNNIHLKKYKNIYNKYLTKRIELENINKTIELSDNQIEFYKYQYDEIKNTNLSIDEKDKLDKEYIILENSNLILDTLSNSFELISKDGGINDNISKIESNIQKIDTYSKEISALLNRIISIRIEINDIENEIQIISEKINSDPALLKIISDRLDHLNFLLKKHKKNSIKELIEVKEDLEKKIESSTNSENMILKKQKEIEELERILKHEAEILSIRRKENSKKFEKKIISYLVKLGIRNPQFKVEFTELDSYNDNGIDKLKFLFSANKGSELKDLSKIASGGEISRLMLCISFIISKNKNLSTIIFDEIDAGVSGEIADLMSKMMVDMSINQQVISVTHLPQIAAKANHHYLVYKSEQSNVVQSLIKKLNKDESTLEIAKMLSGKVVTTSAINNARDLIK